MKRISRKTAVLLAVVTAAIVAAVGAYAYWTTSGTGTGSASTTTDNGVTVNQTSPSSGLYPGGTVGVSGNFTNGEAFNQYVTSVTVSIDAFTEQADPLKPVCTEADFFLTNATVAVGQDITPGAPNGSWSGTTLNMTNAATNQDNCKSITVPLSFTSD